MNPLVILSGGKDALLARETFVTDLYIYIYNYFFQLYCNPVIQFQAAMWLNKRSIIMIIITIILLLSSA